jgi:hypothetical protein
VIALDHLRPPAPGDASAPAYKDWLHVNLFDHSSGAVGLVNVSLHGSPRTKVARAVGTALIELPGAGWIGNLDVRPLDQARISTEAISLDRIAVGIDSRSGLVMASALLPDEGLQGSLTATVTGPPLISAEPTPVNQGWISWYALPRLAVRGELKIGEETLALQRCSGYADHNWGRWFWGQGLGWEWGTFMCEGDGPAVVLAQLTDRLQRPMADPLLEVRVSGARRRFTGSAVRLEWSGVLEAPPRRLPGALAALFTDRAVPRLPARLMARADDGIDMVEVTFTARAAAQLILADPVYHGYSFLHELVGACSCRCRIQGMQVDGSGLAVVEHVD